MRLVALPGFVARGTQLHEHNLKATHKNITKYTSQIRCLKVSWIYGSHWKKYANGRSTL